jgi:hypothetical protein
MSTTTTNYDFIKPDPSEASGADEVAENMILTERVLTNLHLGTSTGRGDKGMINAYRNTNGSAQAINTEGAFDTLTWTNTTATSAWTQEYDLTGDIWGPPALGLPWTYTSGNFEVYHAGYYMITWNLRLLMSGTTMTEGFVRAALIGTDDYATPSMTYGIIGSPTVKAVNTMTNLTDIGAEQLVKLTQLDRPQDEGNQILAGKNQQEYYVDPTHYRYFSIGFAHNNPSSLTATPQATETYIHLEFIRGL